jgi:hypothetical protein
METCSRHRTDEKYVKTMQEMSEGKKLVRSQGVEARKALKWILEM